MNKRFVATAVTSLVLFGTGIGVAEAARDNTNNDHGICTAYFNGNKNGHEQGNGPGPFGALEDAYTDEEGNLDLQALYEGCNAVLGPGGGGGEDQPGNGSHGDGIGGNPDENGRFTDCFDDSDGDPETDSCTDGQA